MAFSFAGSTGTAVNGILSPGEPQGADFVKGNRTNSSSNAVDSES
jgi:hypothetical protein